MPDEVDPRGYTKLWRKIWDNKFLVPTGHEFTRLEAWLDITNRLAAGLDQEDVKRGEFQASIRFLADRWRWSRSRVERYLFELKELGMIQPVGHKTGQQAGHFSVCKYESYNEVRDSKRDTKRDKLKKEKEGLKGSPNGERVAATAETLLQIYNDENRRLPQVVALSDERKRKCRTRISRALSEGRLEAYLENFRQAVARAQLSDFLSGGGEKGWKASFDWFIANDTNVLKVLEGKYDNANTRRNRESHRGNGLPSSQILRGKSSWKPDVPKL